MISQPPKKRLSKRLLEILAISAVAHLAILILFGGYTVYRYVIPSAADFEEPPPMIEETPPPTSGQRFPYSAYAIQASASCLQLIPVAICCWIQRVDCIPTMR